MINWREAPLVRIVLFLIAGILTADSGIHILNAAMLFISVSLVVAVWLTLRTVDFRHRWIFGAAMATFWFGTGYISYTRQIESDRSQHFSHQIRAEQVITGYAEEAPAVDNFIKFTMQVTAIGITDTTMVPCFGKLLVYLKKDSLDNRVIQYGDQITLNARLTPVAGALNPDAFDYRSYLFYKNIRHQAFVDKEQWILSGHNKGNTIWRFAYKCREHCIRVIGRYLGNGSEYAVGSALLLGYKNDIPEEVVMSYMQTGSMHILAVSGLHVGLIYLLLAQVFKRIGWRNRWWKFIELLILFTIVWGFTLLTGASASVLRAATMFSFLITGIHFKRFINIYNTMAASVLSILLWNPFLLFDTGFQLSYAAVLGIVYFQTKLYKLLVFTHIVPDNIWKLTSVSIAAQIGTLPLSLYYFHSFPTWFWLSGLFAIPISTLALYAGIALLVFDLCLPFLAPVAGVVFSWLIWGMNQVVFIVQKFPISTVDGIWISAWEAIMIVALILVLVFVIETRRVRVLAWFGFIFTILILASGVRSVRQYFLNEMTIYHIGRQTLVDWKSGYKVYSICASDLPANKEQQAAQQHRWKNRIRQVFRLPLDTCEVRGSGFYFSDGIFHNDDISIAIVHPSTQLRIASADLDFVLLCGNPAVTISEIAEKFRPSTIIADGSNFAYRVSKWEKESAEQQIPFYNTQKSGAFVWRPDGEK